MTAAGPSDAPTEPAVLAVRHDGAGVELELALPSKLLYFEGHFPGFAILPGVVQVDWAIKFARIYLSLGDSVPSEMQIKFRRPIRPGAPLSLHLALKQVASRPQVTFGYGSAGVACSSGKITLSRR